MGWRLTYWVVIWDGRPVDQMCCLVCGSVCLFVYLCIIICCVYVYVVVGEVSVSISGLLHEPVGELLCGHYFMVQWVDDLMGW